MELDKLAVFCGACLEGYKPTFGTDSEGNY